MLVNAGKRIRALREHAGLNQTQLGEILEIGQSGVSRWESGDRHMDLAKLAEFCTRFRVGFDFLLLGLTEEIHPDLAALFRRERPELVTERKSMAVDTDKLLASYKAAIDLS